MTTINDLSFVMIDPNEDLVLPDGTVITGRLERFIYALCCLDYEHLQTPMSRIEEWANALITNEIPNIDPQSRAEKFFKAILTGDLSDLPEPQSRSEVLLDKIARGDNDLTNIEPIQSRYELLLAYLVKNGGLENLDYVLYEFQKEAYTMLNTVEKPYKSAILSGNTLVNLIGEISFPDSVNHYFHVNLKQYEIGKDYLFMIFNAPEEITEVYFGNGASTIVWRNYTSDFVRNGSTISIKVTCPPNYDGSMILPHVRYGDASLSLDVLKQIKVMLIPYQQGMENWDIPYFEGMQSVKMPVLSTVGKNLFDKSKALENTALIWKNGQLCTEIGSYLSDFIRVDKNTTYYLSGISTIRPNSQVCGYDKDKNLIAWFASDGKETDSGDGLRTNILTVTNSYYIRFSIRNILNIPPNIDEVQLEKGIQATSYEPYKSNILMANEPVELRGVGAVKDELNLLTGEYVQRVGEVVLDGSDDEEWEYSTEDDNFRTFHMRLNGKQNSNNFACDKLLNKSFWNEFVTGIWADSGLIVTLSRNKANSLIEFRNWLSQNPLTVQYELATESVKTVDLTTVDQDGGVLPKPKSYNDVTHVTVSSTDILSSVELEVASKIVDDVLTTSINDSLDTISAKQSELKTVINTQTENGLLAMMATTEIYEDLL